MERVVAGTGRYRVVRGGQTEEQKQVFARVAALGRLGQPQNIADVVTFLSEGGRPMDHRAKYKVLVFPAF
jgi:NAD(P)-dependent dehydrogenase (short-subunit alcohol dehydrogenase family)